MSETTDQELDELDVDEIGDSVFSELILKWRQHSPDERIAYALHRWNIDAHIPLQSDKDFKADIKKLFSSLFERTTTFAVFGYDPAEEDGRQVMFCNLKFVEVEFYAPKALYFTHLLTLQDAAFMKTLLTHFPLLGYASLLLDTRLFCAEFNRVKDFRELSLDVSGTGMVTITTLEGPAVIGRLLTNRHLNLYQSICENGWVKCEEPYILHLKADWYASVDWSNLKMVRCYNRATTTLKDCFTVRVPVMSGLSHVSHREYIGKLKEPGDLRIVSGSDTGAVKVMFLYEDKFCRVISSQPASLWYREDLPLTIKT